MSSSPAISKPDVFSNFVCCSEAVYQSIPEWFQSANMSVIRHGINLKRVHSGRKSNVIFVATRIIRQKNIDSIIRGFAGSSHLHSYKLVVAEKGICELSFRIL